MLSDSVILLDMTQDAFKDYPDVLSVAQLARMLNIGKTSAYELIRSNQIDHFFIGNTYKIPKVHVITYINHEIEKNKTPLVD